MPPVKPKQNASLNIPKQPQPPPSPETSCKFKKIPKKIKVTLNLTYLTQPHQSPPKILPEPTKHQFRLPKTNRTAQTEFDLENLAIVPNLSAWNCIVIALQMASFVTCATALTVSITWKMRKPEIWRSGLVLNGIRTLSGI